MESCAFHNREPLRANNENKAEEQDKTLKNFYETFNNAIKTFIASFYGNLSLTKSAIQKIIKNITEFFSYGLVEPLQKFLDICQIKDIKDFFKIRA